MFDFKHVASQNVLTGKVFTFLFSRFLGLVHWQLSQGRGGGNSFLVSVSGAQNAVWFRGLAENQMTNGCNGNREIAISPLIGEPVLGRYQVGVTDSKTVS